MAEIKIEKKKPIWPWVLLILVVLGVIAYFVYANNDDFDDDYNDDDMSTEQIIDSTDTMSDYDAYDTNNNDMVNEQFSALDASISDSTRIAVDSSYTKAAFANLAKAVVAKAEANTIESSVALTDLRNLASSNTGMSNATKDVNGVKMYKTATDKIATVLQAIQVKNFPSLQNQVADLKQVSSKIDTAAKLNTQQNQIYTFLRQSRDILQMMNN